MGPKIRSRSGYRLDVFGGAQEAFISERFNIENGLATTAATPSSAFSRKRMNSKCLFFCAAQLSCTIKGLRYPLRELFATYSNTVFVPGFCCFLRHTCFLRVF
jgi:hypothetical protein